MRRTTVYLPEVLKSALERVALETGRSEAELIREGIKMAVDQHTPAAPRSGVFASGDPSLAERAEELLEDFGQT